MSLIPLNYTDFIVRDEDRKHLPWDFFNCWMKCFCIVTFDLELGQVIEVNNYIYIELPESILFCQTVFFGCGTRKLFLL